RPRSGSGIPSPSSLRAGSPAGREPNAAERLSFQALSRAAFCENSASVTTTEKRIVLAMSAVVALTRFVPFSKSPWDWDEVLFSMGVRDYNVAQHHPHPAGFPLYIALGKIAALFADTEFHALQVVNVLFAIAVFPVMFWLARSFRLPFATS